ncbi:MAG: leucine--tRNA ligase [Patescibacteria group bacterium]
MASQYHHQEVERRWQQAWERDGVFRVSDDQLVNPQYVLDMFPYPSAQGLHVGHPEGYTASDIYARFLRARGKSVLHPMGFDSFGLPAENYAIKTGTHPAKTTADNIENMRRQIKSLGFSYDWEREVITSDPKYYQWTQWIFIQLFKHGLAYEADAPINWCPKDKTGLANEEVVDGKCERCGAAVTKKQIKQWLVKITDEKYIERLLHGLDDLDWPESIKTLQRNWIGRSEGAEIQFPISNSQIPKKSKASNVNSQNNNPVITVFTTRPDTLFGATYMVLSPEHELVDAITTDKQRKAVDQYKKEAAAKSDLERTDLAKDKTGVFTGAYAINPATHKKIPIWIADYVLSSYGTGAIMAVPAHDERDHAFAQKYTLPIIQVIKPPRVMPKMSPPLGSAAAWGMQDSDVEYTCWTGDGEMVNSGEFDGMDSVEFKKKIVAWLAHKSAGRTCLVIHGLSGHKRENWFPWLKDELKKRGWNPIVPTMPGAGHPTQDGWEKEMATHDQEINERSFLVGHSLGCAAILYHLQQKGQQVDTVILVAPTNPLQKWEQLKKNHPSADWDAVMSMNQEGAYDWQKIKSLARRFVIVYSDNDPYVDQESIEYYKLHLPEAEYHLYPGKSHFSETTGGITALPEILQFFPLEPLAKVAINYKLRDWLFSRQRYWGEPIPIVHCEQCKENVESTPWILHFYETPFRKILSGEKTIETRALNPDEPDRYFADIQAGDVIKGVLKGTNESLYLRVTKQYQFRNLEEFHQHRDLLGKLRAHFDPTLEELKEFYALTPDYVDRIQKNGLVAWEFIRIQPGQVPVPEDQLPLELPDVEKYEPTGTGQSPLAAITDWVNTTCPECGGSAKRETNTMPQWAGSNWYFLRYCDPHNDTQLADPEKLKKWLPVNMYIGGAEHAVLHLLYARFIYMFLYDIGTVPQECGEEPFIVLKNQGLIMGEDGQKMSKSRGNVINPDDVVREYGADVLRMYEMFMGPFEDAKPWSTQGIVGVRRFVEKVWESRKKISTEDIEEPMIMHQTIRSVTEKIPAFRFNTCISDLMKWSNAWGEHIGKNEFTTFLKILAPFAPHLAQELWYQLGHDGYIEKEPWPTFDKSKIVETETTYAVQVNGKLRDMITVTAGTEEADVVSAARASEKVDKHLTGEPRKTIFVKDKLVNFVG